MHSKKLKKNNTDFFINNEELDDSFVVLSVLTDLNLFEFLLVLKQNLNLQFVFFKKNESIIKNNRFEWPIFFYQNENFRTTFYLLPNQSNPSIVKNYSNDLFKQTPEMLTTSLLIPEKDKISYFIIIKNGKFMYAQQILSQRLLMQKNISVQTFSEPIRWEEILFL